MLALAVFIAAASFIFISPTQPAAAADRQVWVYYMGFWGGGPSWDMQADVLTDHPLIGNYDSRDPGVVGTQIDQAKSAGIDAFMVSWFGLDDPLTTTPVLNNVLDRAAERGFHAAAVVDIFNPAFNHGRDSIVASLNYLVYDRANHPGYLRYNGKPVIMFAFQSNAGFSAGEWQSIRNEVDPGRNTIWIAEGVAGCCLYGGAMDGMYAFNIAWANGSASRYVYEKNRVLAAGGTFYIPTVHPGWDETLIAAREHRPNPTSPKARNNGQFLRNTWNGAMAANPDVVLIVSWNEFMENSHIEPSVLYGNQSLDTLRPLVEAWKGTPASAPPAAPPSGGNPAPGGTVVTTLYNPINVRSGPGTTFPIIGQIKPGELYNVTGDQGGWWIINFNGQAGYVYKLVVKSISGVSPAGTPTGQYLQAKSKVNVRTGPGTSYAILSQIKPGETPSPGRRAHGTRSTSGGLRATFQRVL
jgi:uncharacterized protein YraI